LDPTVERKRRHATLAAEQARYMTFKGACEQFIPMKTKTLTNRKHAAQWWSTMQQYAYPTLENMNVDDITVQDILVLLKTIWFEKPETADRVRQRIEAILGWAKVNGHRSGDNPAAWRNNLQMALPSARDAKRAKNDGVERKHPMLSVSDIPKWFNDMKARNGGASQCLCFMAMTSARSETARTAKWDQLDIEKGVWNAPAPNMKTKKYQVYPLGKTAVAFLKNHKQSFEKIPAEDMWVFPSPTGRVLSDTSLSNVMKAVHAAAKEKYVDPFQKRRAVPHGLRATFKTWATEIGLDSDMSEIQLAHQVGDAVFRSYMRTDMLERRREMMTRWESFIYDTD
jgi:integrase